MCLRCQLAARVCNCIPAYAPALLAIHMLTRSTSIHSFQYGIPLLNSRRKPRCLTNVYTCCISPRMTSDSGFKRLIVLVVIRPFDLVAQVPASATSLVRVLYVGGGAQHVRITNLASQSRKHSRCCRCHWFLPALTHRYIVVSKTDEMMAALFPNVLTVMSPRIA